jgi:hypothetical protein
MCCKKWPAAPPGNLRPAFGLSSVCSGSIERFLEGQAFSRSYDSAPRPPPLSPDSKLDTGAHSKTEKERQLLMGEGGGRGGRGAESYDRKKAWPSINHSILSESGGKPVCRLRGKQIRIIWAR